MARRREHLVAHSGALTLADPTQLFEEGMQPTCRDPYLVVPLFAGGSLDEGLFTIPIGIIASSRKKELKRSSDLSGKSTENWTGY